MAHALAAALVVAWVRFPVELGRRAWIVGSFAGLLVVTRHDFALLVGPAVISLLIRAKGRDRWVALLAASFPLFVWSAFSLVYYGSLWPNSAYAKLNNGMSIGESFRAAEPYFRDLIKYDGVTALVIIIAAIRAMLQGAWRMRPLTIGLVLYVLYIGSAGGDYMGDRMFSTPFVLAVAMLAFSVRLRWW